QLLDDGKTASSPDGLSTAQLLTEIGRRTRRLVFDQYACLLKELEAALAAAGVQRICLETLTPNQREHLERIFEHDIYPVITPMAIESGAKFPLVPGLILHLIVRLKPGAGAARKPRYAVLRIPRSLARFIALPETETYAF